jgi:N-acetylneuraminate synthase
VSSGVLVIAEAGMNHDGSVGVAERLVEVAAETGAGAVKFQLHDADAETTPEAPPPPYFTAESREAYFRRTAFTDDEWLRLKDRADALGIEFHCSAFSIEAVERLERIGVARHKVPSGEVTNLPLLERLSQTGKPILLSSGMSSWGELDAAVAALDGADVTLLQCTSEYPCPPERVGLNVLGEMRSRFGLPVGLSDHTVGSAASLAAVALGATVIERHFTLSRRMYGPDAALSVEPDELALLVREIREIERMIASPVDKDDLAPVAEMKEIFEKSVVARVDVAAGELLEPEMLTVKKPGTGIPARRLYEVVGLRARVDIGANRVLRETDVEWTSR